MSESFRIPTSAEELTDSVRKSTAATMRLEAALVAQIKIMTEYVQVMDKIYRELLAINRPWWKR